MKTLTPIKFLWVTSILTLLSSGCNTPTATSDSSGNSSVSSASASSTPFLEAPDTSENFTGPGMRLLAGHLTTAGLVDGVGANARFYFPAGIVVIGNTLYLTDFGQMIRKVDTTTGLVTSVAGSPNNTSDVNGLGATSTFTIADITNIGTNLYFSDINNCEIKKFDSLTTQITVLAGSSGNCTDTDGTGVGATFNQPGIMTNDGKVLYVIDYGTGAIRKVDPNTGVVTSLSSTVGSPNGMTYLNGNLYISNRMGGEVDKVNIRNDSVTFFAGGFTNPGGIATDGSSIYVADAGHHQIAKVNLGGTVTSLLGGSFGMADGIGTAAQFNDPQSIRYFNNNFYITDQNTLRIANATTLAVGTLAGVKEETLTYHEGTGTGAVFSSLEGLDNDGAGNLYVADYGNSSIRKVTQDGTTSLVAGVPGQSGFQNGAAATALFSSPQGILYVGGVLYVADSENFKIRKIANGIVSTLSGTTRGDQDGNAATAQFSWPTSISIIGTDLFVNDNGKIKKVSTLDGSAVTINDGSVLQASGVTALNGYLYVADWSDVIYKMDTSGNITLLAGQIGVNTGLDGIGTAATFIQPMGITSDGVNTLYVIDDSLIRSVDATTGETKTITGAAGIEAEVDGPLAKARITNQSTFMLSYTPFGIAVGSQNNVRMLTTH